MFGADQLGPRLNIVILRDSHQSGYILGSVGPLRHLGDALQGEAKEAGRLMAGIATSAKRNGQPIKGPALLLSGGETTVAMGKEFRGRGGRNTEFLLSLAIELKGADGIWAVAGDTDGIDGSEDAAGAFVKPTTIHQSTHPRKAALLRREANWMLCLYGRQYRQCENRGFNDREAAAS